MVDRAVVAIYRLGVGSNCRVEVNWCRLGEEPSSDPFVFWNYEEALRFLKEEFEYLAYSSSRPNATGDAQKAIILQCRDAITCIQLRRGSLAVDVEDCSFTIGDICYWLKGT
jgi:hypothetical protein